MFKCHQGQVIYKVYIFTSFSDISAPKRFLNSFHIGPYDEKILSMAAKLGQLWSLIRKSQNSWDIELLSLLFSFVFQQLPPLFSCKLCQNFWEWIHACWKCIFISYFQLLLLLVIYYFIFINIEKKIHEIIFEEILVYIQPEKVTREQKKQ